MKNSKNYSKMLTVLFVAAFPIVLMAGCRGNIGWDRMDGSLGRQSHSGSHQPRKEI